MSVNGHLTREFRVLCLLQGALRELRRTAGVAGTQDGWKGHRADVGVAHACALVLNDCRPADKTSITAPLNCQHN